MWSPARNGAATSSNHYVALMYWVATSNMSSSVAVRCPERCFQFDERGGCHFVWQRQQRVHLGGQASRPVEQVDVGLVGRMRRIVDQQHHAHVRELLHRRREHRLEHHASVLAIRRDEDGERLGRAAEVQVSSERGAWW